MDIVTLGAALNGSAEYVNSHFKGGSNIQIVDNPDGTQTINASGEVSAEDTVARAEIAEMKDGETLDSFGDVETALGDKADTSTTYTKTEVDTALSAKADKSTTYTKTEVDTALGNKADKLTTYTKTEVDTALSAKANVTDVYSKSDVETALSGKVDKETGKGLSTNDYTTVEKSKLAGIATGAEVNVQSDWNQTTDTADDYIKNKPTLGTAAAKNATDTYNATGTDVTTGKAVAAALATLPEPMMFKGSLGTGGTITTLPTASSSNKGYVYKVITAGTYASQSAKVGDTFISDGSAWVLIPSGDEPSGTVTNVAVANGGGITVSGSPITSSGTITVGHSNSVTAKTSSSVKKFTYDAYGHVTGSSELSTAESNALASGIDSTKVAQIETNKNNISTVQSQANWNSNNGVKNIITGGENSTTRNNVTFTVNTDSSITVKTGTGGASGSDATFFKVSTNTVMTSGTWVLSGGHSPSCRLQDANNNWQSGTTATEKTFSTDTTYSIFIRVQPGWTNIDGVTLYPMICPKSLYDADPTYQPYAMSNSELTEKEQANKNNILSLTENGGGKNLLNHTATTQGIWTVNADRTITATGTGTATLNLLTITSGDNTGNLFKNCILTGCPNISGCNISIERANSPYTVYAIDTGNGAEIDDIPASIPLVIFCRVGSGTTVDNAIFKPMISTGGGDYQPYAMSNAELTAAIQAIQAQLANQ